MKKIIIIMLVASIGGLVACNNKAAEEAEAKLQAMQDSIAEAEYLDSIATVEAAQFLADSLAKVAWEDSVRMAAEKSAKTSVKKVTPKTGTNTIGGRKQKVEDAEPEKKNTIGGRRGG